MFAKDTGNDFDDLHPLEPIVRTKDICWFQVHQKLTKRR
ncbi:hypothetical protein S7335_278 [Synechococcus sp. PCC 7335]|nr:hypothetical protein S7335_278 [Synechococcus sp. PCC 7335]